MDWGITFSKVDTNTDPGSTEARLLASKLQKELFRQSPRTE